LGKHKGEYQNLSSESLCLYELKQYTPWLDKKCSRFLDQRKQSKNVVFTRSNRKQSR